MDKYRNIAENILAEHTTAYFNVGYDTEVILNEMTVEEMHTSIANECGFILSQMWIEGKYSTREYFAIRNEIAKLLDGIFTHDLEVDGNIGK